ncbi:MAG: hypothetical protein RLW61_24170, partial [Gammaproteobacteria bacterium]
MLFTNRHKQHVAELEQQLRRQQEEQAGAMATRDAEIARLQAALATCEGERDLLGEQRGLQLRGRDMRGLSRTGLAGAATLRAHEHAGLRAA